MRPSSLSIVATSSANVRMLNSSALLSASSTARLNCHSYSLIFLHFSRNRNNIHLPLNLLARSRVGGEVGAVILLLLQPQQRPRLLDVLQRHALRRSIVVPQISLEPPPCRI